MLSDFAELINEQGVFAKIPNNVKEHLLIKGYSKEYGVRALKRTVEKELIDIIAGELIKTGKRPLKLTIKLTKAGNLAVVKGN